MRTLFSAALQLSELLNVVNSSEFHTPSYYKRNIEARIVLKRQDTQQLLLRKFSAFISSLESVKSGLSTFTFRKADSEIFLKELIYLWEHVLLRIFLRLKYLCQIGLHSQHCEVKGT